MLHISYQHLEEMMQERGVFVDHSSINLMHMIRKGQLMPEGGDEMPFADQFYALAG